MRVLVTGSRNWTDRETIEKALELVADVASVCADLASPKDITVVHGGARGVDTIAAEVAREYGMRVEEHRADWDRYGRSAGPRRNAEMVAAGADVCLAFPLGESRGTRGCMALAAKAGIEIVNYGDEA